jgi:hypothetical protein
MVSKLPCKFLARQVAATKAEFEAESGHTCCLGCLRGSASAVGYAILEEGDNRAHEQ